VLLVILRTPGAVSLALSLAACAAAASPFFREHTLASDLKGGYQIVAADVNGDSRTDLIALASGMPDLVWFENPTWERRILASPFERMINLATHDLDGDRIPEIIVAAGWNTDAKKSAGTVWLLRHDGDPRNKWQMTEIDRLPSSHRIRVAQVDKGKPPLFINAPLTGADVEGPEYRGAAPLVFYEAGEWKRRTISTENHGVVHGLEVLDWDGDGRDDVLTASFEGVHWFRRSPDGKWVRSRILEGDPSPWPRSGASEIKVGRGNSGRFLATVEPWHGNQVVVYTGRPDAWRRKVIDNSQTDIHSLRVSDINADGRDDIVAAVRGRERRVVLYLAGSDNSWTRQILDDGGIAAADCAVADLNGDRLSDIACIGSTTANVKWFENMGAAPQGSPSDDAAFAVVEKIAGEVGFYNEQGTRVAGTRVGEHPHEIIKSPDGRYLYVSDNGILWMTNPGAGGNTISIIDVEKRARIGTIDLGDTRRPHGMDIDRKTNRMVVTVENPPGLLLINLASRKVLRKYDTKGPAPHMVLLTNGGQWAYVSNTGSNTIAAIHLDSGEVKLITTDARPQGGVLSQDGSLAYIVNSDGHSISIIDTRQHERIGMIATGKNPGRIRLTPDGETLVYNLQGDHAVGFADVRSRRQTHVAPIGGAALSLTMSPDGRWAYAGIQDQDKVAVVSVPERKLVRAIPITKGAGPDPALPLR
jgi:DNA-binding beta-propeller fold protein YncE